MSEHAQFKLSLDQARALADEVQRVVAEELATSQCRDFVWLASNTQGESE